MATPTNAKPRPAPVVVRHDNQGSSEFLRLLPAALGSAVFHALLFGALFLFSSDSPADTAQMEAEGKEDVVKVDAPEKPREANDPFVTEDIDPARQEFDTDIQYKNERIAEFSVPGLPNASEAVGIVNAAKDAPPTNLPAPGGLGSIGQGGALPSPDGGLTAMGQVGGYGPRGLPLAGSFYGRSGSTREYALRNGGGPRAIATPLTPRLGRVRP